MPRIVPLSVWLLLMLAVSASAQEKRGTVSGAENHVGPVVQKRDGLPNVFARLRAGQSVTIAYFGGSITAGAGASDAEKTSYRARTTAWFRRRFPKAAITEVNAAVGGTGSTLGTFRCRRDVLARKPDLVFVEYAVNDGGTPAEAIDRAMEGIVRQIRRADPRTDLCFVYTLHQGMLAGYKAGTLPDTVVRHERIAAHYKLPSVNMGQVVAEQINVGRITQTDFAKDGVHPTDPAYQTYTDTLTGFLETCAVQAPKRPRAYRLPAPLRADSWQNGNLVEAASLSSSPPSGWQSQLRPGQFGSVATLASETPGAEFTFPFQGDTIGLYYVLGSDTGACEYRLDAGDWKRFAPFDEFALQFDRPSYQLLAEHLASGAHTLALRVRPDHDPRSKGNWTRFAFFLVNPSILPDAR